MRKLLCYLNSGGALGRTGEREIEGGGSVH